MKNPFLSVAVVLSLAFVLGTQPVALRAQAPSAAPQTPTQTQTPNTAPAQKKVWTNDDMDELRDQGAGGISVIGSAPAAAATPAAAKVPDEKNPDWYRKQLAPLYESLDRINDQIAAAQSAIDGDSRGDSGVSMGARAPAGTPAEQVTAPGD